MGTTTVGDHFHHPVPSELRESHFWILLRDFIYTGSRQKNIGFNTGVGEANMEPVKHGNKQLSLLEELNYMFSHS